MAASDSRAPVLLALIADAMTAVIESIAGVGQRIRNAVPDVGNVFVEPHPRS